MNHIDSSHQHLSRTNWQRLGELKLRAGSTPDGTIKAWLMDSLGELSLPDDLVRRLLASIEEATVRVLSPDSKQGEYLEIVLLAPTGQASNGHIWGYFRVERMSVESPMEGTKGQCVEYYLYLDSKTGK